jgi:hypothetical protein
MPEPATAGSGINDSSSIIVKIPYISYFIKLDYKKKLLDIIDSGGVGSGGGAGILGGKNFFILNIDSS